MKTPPDNSGGVFFVPGNSFMDPFRLLVKLSNPFLPKSKIISLSLGV